MQSMDCQNFNSLTSIQTAIDSNAVETSVSWK